MLIDTLSKVKNYNAQSKHYNAPYLSSKDMENIEYALETIQKLPKVIEELECAEVTVNGHKDSDNNCGGCAGCSDCKMSEAFRTAIDIVNEQLS